MSTKTYRSVSNKATPQSQPIPGRTDQIKNSAGGYVFKADDWKRLNRFLILGTEHGTYYINEPTLTRENADVVMRCLTENPVWTIDAIVNISKNNRAYKNDPAIFALALAMSGSPDARALATKAVPIVCRIPTHLFHFVQYCTQFRGWGRGLRNVVADWYLFKDTKDLAYHAIKYQSRDGWSNADLVRLSHPKTEDNEKNQVFRWMLEKEFLPDLQAKQILAFEEIKIATTEKQVVNLIHDHNLPRECVPTQWLNKPIVWEALAENMPMTALIRNLGKMTSVGMIAPMREFTGKFCDRITNVEQLKKSRIHPMQLLLALKTYSQGKGEKGSLTWTPVQRIVDALDEAFYLSFDNVEPTGKRLLISVDSSGSMGHPTHGSPLRCIEAAVAMALINAHVEKNYVMTAFDTKIWDMPISPRERMDDVLRKVGGGGGTDCSLPMAYLLGKKLSVDGILLYTDSESWAGHTHPYQAMDEYRRQINPQAKLVLVAAEANVSTIVDPKGTDNFEVVGFDANAPRVISDFVRGDL